jgi:hypothetical protein
MKLKRKIYTPQEYIQVGMAFFLIGIFISQVADGRLIGGLLASLLPDNFSIEATQEFTAGLSIPIFIGSIFFNLRGLILLRS